MAVQLATGEALQRIKRSTLEYQTPEDRKAVDYVLRTMSPTDSSTCCTMVDFAIQTKDLDLWRRIVSISNADNNITVVGKQQILQACQTFWFEPVRDV
jgi:hypothetical protein